MKKVLSLFLALVSVCCFAISEEPAYQPAKAHNFAYINTGVINFVDSAMSARDIQELGGGYRQFFDNQMSLDYNVTLYRYPWKSFGAHLRTTALFYLFPHPVKWNPYMGGGMNFTIMDKDPSSHVYAAGFFAQDEKKEVYYVVRPDGCIGFENRGENLVSFLEARYYTEGRGLELRIGAGF